jgi:hypothetical protein
MRRGKLRACRARRVKRRRGEGLVRAFAHTGRAARSRWCGNQTDAGQINHHGVVSSLNRLSVAVRRQGWPPLWTWEIRQGSLPLAVRASVDSFTSEMAAQRAGEKALSRFLAEVAEEEQNLI